MIVLGLVGAPAGGKSTAAAFLAEQGAEWINADLIARECLQHPSVIEALTERFGAAILTSDGHVDRGKIADLVFGTDSIKRENLGFLQSLVHPQTRIEITRRVAAAAQSGQRVALLDIPLMFESGWDRSCDSIWCVDAPRASRLQWSEKRGWDAAELDRREANQLAIEAKRRLSQVVVRNDSTLEALHQILRCHWEQLVRIGETPGKQPISRDRHCLSDRIEK